MNVIDLPARFFPPSLFQHLFLFNVSILTFSDILFIPKIGHVIIQSLFTSNGLPSWLSCGVYHVIQLPKQLTHRQEIYQVEWTVYEEPKALKGWDTGTRETGINLAVDEQTKEGNRKTSEGSTLSVNVLFHSMSVQRSINCFPLPKPNIRSNLWRLIHKMDSLASWTSAWLATWIASCSVWQTLLVSWSTSTVRNLVR